MRKHSGGLAAWSGSTAGNLVEGSTIRVGRHRLSLTNLDKMLYPGGRFTKGQVLDYYARIAPVLLPHFRGRPVTLVRYPDGVFQEAFYEKNAPAFTPSWIKTAPVPRSGGGVIRYIVIDDLPTLIWAANLAALELHPFLHRARALDRPTHVVFDLDPGDGADLLSCCEVALLVRDLMGKLVLQSFPKVSGSKGIQVYVPLNTPTSYEDSHAFARAIAELLERQHRGQIVSEMARNLRAGKVFIDWSQNTPSKTTVGAYSLRAKNARPLVSMPVDWVELEVALKSRDPHSLVFSPDRALERVKERGDLFEPVLRVKQRLPREFSHLLETADRPKALARYASKRNFARTSEPGPVIPRRSAQGSRRRFVVQKHAASHLHYDFRLEMHAVLKSWAVPKGVPLRPNQRHSAFATEDHPLEYLEFEGIIPEGEYGGGTVMVWDIGNYEPVSGNYYQGELNVFLTGRKLKGEWNLKRTRTEDGSEGKDVWLLTRTSGRPAHIPKSKAELSALTGRTMEQIAHERNAIWSSHRETQKAPPRPVVNGAGLKAPAPKFVPPMKPMLVDCLPEGPDWIYEVKWDGYRALAAKHGEEVWLLSLKNNNLAQDFPTVVNAIRSIPAAAALIDGEIVAVDASGKPSFQALQNRSSLGRDWTVVYYAFDLLSLNGEDLRSLPLLGRKGRLAALLKGTGVRFSAELPGSPEEIVGVVQRSGLEGVVAKNKGSTYASGARSTAWQKLKFGLAQEFVIGGFNPEGKTFSSMLVGYYSGRRLMFAGKVRQGLTPGLRAKLMKAFAPLATDECPFLNLPISKTGHFGEGITREDMAKLRWLRPKLVAQVSFTEWTSYGLLRHATFVGLREDKRPTEVVREEVRG